MPKTPLKSRYLKGLADLNDQFCFFLFASEELRRGLSRLGKSAQALHLPDIFGGNEYAPKIHIRVGDVDSFEAERDRFTSGSYVSTSYELTSSYLTDAVSLLRSTNPAFQTGTGRSPEEQYWNTLSASSCTTPPKEDCWTLEYIRLRRNVFIHLAAEPSQSLKNLISNRGPSLNSYWSSSIRELDFTSPDILSFRERESIDLLQILRIIVERLDGNLAPQLDRNGVIRLVAEEIFGTKPCRMNSAVAEERVQKLRGIIAQQLGLDCTNQELDPVVRVVGVRA
jgi:hypothetical protein